LRATSLLSLTLLFAVGTRLIAPAAAVLPDKVAREGPDAASPVFVESHTPQISDAPRTIAERANVEDPPPPTPPTTITPAPIVMSEQTGEPPPAEPSPIEPPPIEPSPAPRTAEAPPVAEAASEPEPNFPYAEAKKVIDEQQKYLRSACLSKAAKPTNRLKLRVDVRPSGRPSVRVFWSSDKEVRICVRNAFLFMFDPTPRGGAFEYVLTESGGSTLHRLPLDPKLGK